MHSTGKRRDLIAATVTEVEDLAPRVRRVRFAGPSLVGMDWKPGQKIKIEAGNKMRSYTPARVDTKAGWMDVVFFLHGNGPASLWASSVGVGQAARFKGPVKSMPSAKKTPDWAMFLGDETAIGLAAALLEDLPKTVQVVGAIEVDALDSEAVEAFGLTLSVAIRQQQHGAALLKWLSQTKFPEGRGMIWLSGEANSVRALKLALAKRGPSNVKFKMKAYWSNKGHAHRKALENMDRLSNH
jgi:NADPH-dependent ferric siderophore reductase